MTLAAGIFVKFAADIAGNVPVMFAAGTFVKFAADIAGSVPVIFAAGTFVKFAADIAGNVPLNCAAGSDVKLAPDPLNVVAVTIPAKSTPVSAKVTVPSPLRFSILLTLISDAIWVHFPPLF